MALQFIFVLNTIFFGSLVSGLSIDSPASGSQLDVSRKTTVTWFSDSSDPDKFGLYLINDARLPSINLKIASDIDTSAGSYSFDGIDAIPGSGYRFDLKDTNDSNILAQSDQFIIVSKGTDTTVASAGSSSTVTRTTTSTTTVDSGDTDSTTITSTSSDDDTTTKTEVATMETTAGTTLIASSASPSEYVSESSTPSSSNTGSAVTTTPNSAPSLTCESPSPSVMAAIIALFAWMCISYISAIASKICRETFVIPFVV
ncbi:GPI anchored serine-threonine rich family protein [Aspergillus lucknowensis]|uniref:Yeast cell wall synthesis Kre9/Knh1-like N-terminal domain-containing protein n=1 Tax=Aspergillus lucknowensis TaxID=176173 RepID=A0ABR4LKY6_9EURO